MLMCSIAHLLLQSANCQSLEAPSARKRFVADPRKVSQNTRNNQASMLRSSEAALHLRMAVAHAVDQLPVEFFGISF